MFTNEEGLDYSGPFFCDLFGNSRVVYMKMLPLQPDHFRPLSKILYSCNPCK